MCLLLKSGFRLATQQLNAWLVECCRDGCPSGRLSHLHRGTLELCQSDHWAFGHLPNQGPSPPIAQAASSRKSLGGSKLLPFLWTFNFAKKCCYPSSDLCLNTILSRSSMDNSFRPHGLVFALTCTVNCGTLYRPMCAFQNHVQSIKCMTGGLQSSWSWYSIWILM